jgi:hypothetical protein
MGHNGTEEQMDTEEEKLRKNKTRREGCSGDGEKRDGSDEVQEAKG